MPTPTQYFAFNTLAGVSRQTPSIVMSTTAGRFDSAYVSRAIFFPNAGAGVAIRSAPFFDGSNSIAGTFWLRFDIYSATNWANGFDPITIFNGAVNAFRVNRASSTTGQFQYWNTSTNAWVNWGAAFAYTFSTLRTWVLKVIIGAGFELYFDGVLVASDGGVAPVNSAAQVTAFQWGAGNVSTNTFISQVMCANYDLLLSNYMERPISGEGTYTDGTGVYSDVIDSDDGTYINLPAAGNKHTFTKGAIVTPAGKSITGLVANMRGRIGSGVTDGKLTIRSGGSNQSSGAKALAAGYLPRGHFFPTDPATSADWTQAAINASEVGAEAA
jgi:hypothetical protein